MRSVVLCVAALCAGWSSLGSATVLQYDLNQEYTGGQHPAGPAPWLRILLDDHNANGSVTLTIQSLTLVDSEFVSKVLLNVKSGVTINTLTASAPNKTGTFTDPSVEFGSNAFHAGGGSTFDMLVNFATGGPENRFGAGDSTSLNIGGYGLLNSGSFNAISSGGSGTRFVSGHVQGIGNGGGGSGWLTSVAPTPEPTSLCSLVALLGLTRRRR